MINHDYVNGMKAEQNKVELILVSRLHTKHEEALCFDSYALKNGLDVVFFPIGFSRAFRSC